MYMLVFHCTAIGGELAGHPLETADVGWFGRDALPAATAGAHWWGPMAFAAIDGEDFPTHFDAVSRAPMSAMRRSSSCDRSALVAVAQELFDLLHQLARI